MKDRKGTKLSKAVTVAACVIILITVLFQTVVGMAVVKGNSMSPFYKDGDLVIYLRVDRQYEAGDVILFHGIEDKDYIKRVVGVPGDRVYIDQRTETVYVNDTELKETSVLTGTKSKDFVDYPVTLQEDEYFVLGDNRADSVDSRNFGVVTAKQIMGRELITFGKNRRF